MGMKKTSSSSGSGVGDSLVNSNPSTAEATTTTTATIKAKKENNNDPSAVSKPSQRLFLVFLVVIVGCGVMILLASANSLPSAASWNDPKVQTAVRKSMEEFKSTARKMSQEYDNHNTAAAKAQQQQEEENSNEQQVEIDNAGEVANNNNDNTAAQLGHLSCSAHGGPSDEFAQEMVYWQDIPSDRRYVSPFHKKAKAGSRKQYMTFEPDGGGWNNIRMAMETVLGIAIAMGRTLVLPPAKKMYLLGKQDSSQKNRFSFADFFPMQELAQENDGLEMITTEEFLEREGLTGNLRHKDTGKVEFPPGNRTDWEGIDNEEYNLLKEWLRNVSVTPMWSPGQCLAAFPASGDLKDAQELQAMQKRIHEEGLAIKDHWLDNPPPVDAPPIERMRENLSGRRELCIYDEHMQQAHVVHFMCYHKLRVRMLVHFYAFLFFEDWREDLWMKRFMRDHVRYIDEIQCAAARLVHAMREFTKSKTGSEEFDTFHIRRGDFQFTQTRISAEDIYKNTKDILKEGAVIYIATDERDKKFFEPLRQHYTVKFMDDFSDELKGVNTNYYGMIDQLVASRGRLFFGCWHSTFTGFIHRMRGYHAANQKLPGHEKGTLNNSFYYVKKDNIKEMHTYSALYGAFFNREFPTSWRNLDQGIGQLPNIAG